MAEFSLEGIIDMHVHTNPDVRLRAYDDIELMQAAINVGARAIVIKSHQGTTQDRAYLCNQFNHMINKNRNHFTMFGSITLNRQVGGINPWAVESSLKLGAKVVWLPTQSAHNHLVKKKLSPDSAVEVVRDGKIVPELNSVFALIKDFDATLGTGHISQEEIFTVVEAARKAGLKKIVVTHPEWWIVGMGLEEQIRIVKDYDVILEHCYASNMGDNTYQSNMEVNLEAIQAVGYKNIMCDTDGGQVENPHWEIAFQQYGQYLLDHGIPLEHIRYMTHTIPMNLLGLQE